MMKRILALLLCLVMLSFCFAGCARNMDDVGAYIRMYVSEPVYDFDPLTAFDNEASLQVISLLYEPLFYADENGVVQKGLVKDYEYIKDEEKDSYKLMLYLKETCWSDGMPLTASDAVFAFQRLFDTEVSHPATALLYDVKGARDIIAGDSESHLRVSDPTPTTVEIEFERDINVDAFLATLCSPAFYPLRSNVVDHVERWSKTASVVCSGPFTVRSMNFEEEDGFILERNSYYYRDREVDSIDKYVTPYRLIVDYTVDADEQLMGNYGIDDKGGLYFFGYIPYSVRNNADYASILEDVQVRDAASTHTYYFNHNDELLSNAAVRKALSLALDRTIIAEALVYARAAEGAVPYTVRNRADKYATFRLEAERLIAANANVEEAERLLAEAGINPKKETIDVTVAAYDQEHLEIFELVEAAWEALGFKVNINKLGLERIFLDSVDEKGQPIKVDTGAYRNHYREALENGDFQVIALDLVSTSVDAFGYLAPFAKAFSGNDVDYSNPESANSDELMPHITGYDSEAYNQKIEAAFATDNLDERAALLHEAEEILIAEDMAILPIVHNQFATLCTKQLKKVGTRFFCPAYFRDTKQSDYINIADREGFYI